MLVRIHHTCDTSLPVMITGKRRKTGMADDKEGASSDGTNFWADALRRFDAVRRWRGNAMDSMGIGRQETAFRTVLDDPDVRLRLYGENAVGGPAVLIVP